MEAEASVIAAPLLSVSVSGDLKQISGVSTWAAVASMDNTADTLTCGRQQSSTLIRKNI